MDYAFTSMPRSLPETQGVSSAGILNYLQAVDRLKLDLHSIMFIRNGYVIAEKWWAPYRAELKHTMYSVSKSFTSSAVGIAVTDGLLSLDDHIIDFFPGELSEMTQDNFKLVTIRNLLMMSTGQEQDLLNLVFHEKTADWVAKFFSIPVKFQPGYGFEYNSGATYMLSVIVQKVTGESLCDYLRSRLFQPLGIADYVWDVCPQGYTAGGWGLNLRTEDLAKFGQLYLQQGQWDGRQILSPQWINEAASWQISNRPNEDSATPVDVNATYWGYGYQFWMGPRDSYRAEGAFGQASVVVPSHNLVVAYTSGIGNEPAKCLDLIWECLMPALNNNPLPSNSEAQKQIDQLSLQYLPPVSNHTSAIESKISQTTYHFATNNMTNNIKMESVSFAFHSDECTITLNYDKKVQTIRCGKGSWIDNLMTMSNEIVPFHLGQTLLPAPVAASCTWQDPNTFIMIWRYIGTALHDTVKCLFDQDSVHLSIAKNVPEMPVPPREWTGTAV